jgi:uncharacterized membrane protein YphA (DoxX/SURF4 family)
MFSMFPDGWPGAGLLLLRVAAGAVVVAQGVSYLSNRHEPGVSGLAVFAVAGAVAVLLVIGFLTRLVALTAAMAGGIGVFSWFPVFNSSVVTPTVSALSAVIALAVMCLGPGALSLDARLFGRREIVIPPSSPKA